jgi:bifunctional non-homologous end joining protein LigD
VDKRVRLFTRSGNDWSEFFPDIVATISALQVQSCLIDGEVTVCDAQGISVFELLPRGPRVKRNAILFAFDLLELDGRDLTREPIESRKAMLSMLLKGCAASVQLLKHLQVEGQTLFELICEMGCEGILSKRLGSKYRQGPNKCPDWIR